MTRKYTATHESATFLIGVLTLWLGYLAALRLYPARPEIAVATVWTLALHPQLVFINAYVNNDSSAILACGLLWYVWVRIAREGPKWSLRLLLGAGTGLALLSKVNSAAAIVAGAPIVVWQLWVAGKRWVATSVAVLAGWCRGLIVCLPWLLWSWHHHHAWLGLEIHRQWWIDHVKKHGIQQGFLTLDNLSAFLAGTWKTFWGSFGYCSTFLPEGDYQLVAGAVGLGIGVLLTRIPQRLAQMPPAERTVPVLLASTLMLGGLASLAGHLYHAAQFGLTAQGRYLMPAIWAVMTTLATGYALLSHSRRTRHWGTTCLVALLAWLQLASLEVEKKSNRLPQPDRRVKAWLLSYAGPLPGKKGYCCLNLDPLGDARLSVTDGVYQVTCASRSDGVTHPAVVPADRLGWVLIEQQLQSGPGDGGRLGIRLPG